MNKMSFVFVLFCFSSLGITLGCNRDSSKTTPVNQTSKGPSSAREQVIVRVNGIDYTAKMMKEDSALHHVFLEKKLTSDGLSAKDREARVKEFDKNYCQKSLIGVIKNICIQSAIQSGTNQVCVSDAVRNEYASKMKKMYSDFRELEEHVSSLKLKGSLQRNLIWDQCRLDFICAATNDGYRVSDAEVARLLKLQDEVSHNISISNAAIYASASNAVASLRAGEPLEKCAKRLFKTSEMGEIEDFENVTSEDFFTEDELVFWPRIEKLGVGGVSEVIEFSEGLAVFRRMKDSIADDMSETNLNFKALIFRRMVPLEILDAKGIQTEMAHIHANELIQESMKKILYTAEIIFPSGEEQIPASVKKFVTELRKRHKVVK